MTDPVDFNFSNDTNCGYFVWCDKKDVVIEKLHLCSWDLINGKSLFEIGVLFSREKSEDEANEKENVEFSFGLPWNVSGSCHDVYPAFTKSSNIKFVFNKRIGDGHPLDGGDEKTGKEVDVGGEKIVFLPVKCWTEGKQWRVVVTHPLKSERKFYWRICFEFNRKNPIVRRKREISSFHDTYDIQVNEWRREPEEVPVGKVKQNFEICKILQSFCLHVLPRKSTISFVDPKTFKNSRLLEYKEFHSYIQEVFGPKNIIKDDAYFVVFNKSRMQGEGGEVSHSFFTIISHEFFGLTQITFAIGLNIVCSGCLAILSVKFSDVPDRLIWYNGYLVAGVVVLMVSVFFGRRFINWIFSLFRR